MVRGTTGSSLFVHCSFLKTDKLIKASQKRIKLKQKPCLVYFRPHITLPCIQRNHRDPPKVNHRLPLLSTFTLFQQCLAPSPPPF